MHEAADETDGSPADQQEEYEDVERGHLGGASLGKQPMKASSRGLDVSRLRLPYFLDGVDKAFVIITG